jgi:periplasmic protein TonB
VKNSLTGLSLSVLFHLCLVAAVLSLSLSRASDKKPISLDFTLITEAGSSRSAVTPGGSGSSTQPIARKGGGLISGPQAAPKVETAPVPLSSTTAAPKGVSFEPAGPVVVGGEAGSSQGRGEGAVVSHEGAGYGAGGEGSGRGGQGYGLNFGEGRSGSTEFAFIRHDILKNIRYPEKARRMRWEGRVVVGFSVLENGAVREVVVVKSSGFPALDESARVAVLKTAFSRKIPRRLDVVLPVEYKLQ